MAAQQQIETGMGGLPVDFWQSSSGACLLLMSWKGGTAIAGARALPISPYKWPELPNLGANPRRIIAEMDGAERGLAYSKMDSQIFKQSRQLEALVFVGARIKDR